MSHIKILIISSVTDKENNGLAVVFKSFVKELKESSIQFNTIYYFRNNNLEFNSYKDQNAIYLKPLTIFETLSSFLIRSDTYYFKKFNDVLSRFGGDSKIIFFGSLYDPIVDYLSIKMKRKVFVHCNDSIFLYESRRVAFLNNFFRKLVSKLIESRRLRNKNLTLVYVGKLDYDYAKLLFYKNTSLLIPLGVDCDVFKPANNFYSEKKIILFTGDLRYQPNIDAVKVLINDILPRLSNDFILHIVGRGPSEDLSNFCNIDRVFLFADVENIVLEYQKAYLFIAPMFSGSGMKNKILESLACGVPVLTTNIEFESFENPPDGILFFSSLNDMIIIANELSKQIEYRNELSALARNHVQKNFSWKKRNLKLITSLSNS
jgi:glycosyltransferase involved in cell wall biosynthesis